MLWKLPSEEQHLKVETRLMSYRTWNWQMNSAAIPASHLSPFYFNQGFHPTTEADIYAHFSPAQGRREHVHDFFQLINQDLSTAYQTMKVAQKAHENARVSSSSLFKNHSW